MRVLFLRTDDFLTEAQRCTVQGEVDVLIARVSWKCDVNYVTGFTRVVLCAAFDTRHDQLRLEDTVAEDLTDRLHAEGLPATANELKSRLTHHLKEKGFDIRGGLACDL
jgi:hypothetical protein